MTPEDILYRYWQYPAFRPLQKEIIESVLEHTDTLALLPTGGGKSICYQVPALLLPGTCLVISPLIALMQDQVARLKVSGIPAAALYAGMQPGEVAGTLEAAAAGAYRLLYLSPERLQSKPFQNALPGLSLSLIAIDEAHCISQWGHDFRPDYLKISLLREVFPETPVIALTATATTAVQEDIQKQLRMKSPQVFRQSFRRTGLSYLFVRSEHKSTDTIRLLKNLTHGAAIVYCRSRRQAEYLTAQLHKNELPASCYHAGMSRQDRLRSFHNWTDQHTPVMVATTAFGMGIDRQDVRLVLHYDLPDQPEAYYQEAGRAGRDGKPAQAVLLYQPQDLQKLKESIYVEYPPEDFLRKVYQAVAEYLQIPVGTEPGKYYPFSVNELINRFRLPARETAHALRLLEQEDLWTLSEGTWQQDRIFCKADRQVLERFAEKRPDFQMALITAFQSYGTLFSYNTPVNLNALSQKSGLNPGRLREIFRYLDLTGMIAFHEGSDEPRLYFHHRRADSRHLILNRDRLLELRKKKKIRTDAMIDLITRQDICKEKLLLKYFGEASKENCGCCTNCLEREAGHIPRNTIILSIRKILEAGPADTQAILQAFPHANHQAILLLLRELSDDEILSKNPLGEWTLDDAGYL